MSDNGLVHLVLEHVDLGDRVRGVFSDPGDANEAIRELKRRDAARFGAVGIELPHDYLARFRVTTFALNELDYP